MRNMSFALTTVQIGNRTKTVTRRVGWWNGDAIYPTAPAVIVGVWCGRDACPEDRARWTPPRDVRPMEDAPRGPATTKVRFSKGSFKAVRS